MSTDLDAGIVRILKPDGTTAGTGFVVSDDGCVATSSHVVQSKGSLRRGEPRPERVDLVFPTTGDCRQAKVVSDWWRSVDDLDVAILRIERELPIGVQALPLGSSLRTSGHDVQTFGFPKIGKVDGLWGRGKVLGLMSEDGQPLLQLQSNQITSGFSGAPVWDEANRRVIGMVISIVAPDCYGRLRSTAFVTPIETLVTLNPALTLRWPAPVEAYLASVRDYCANLPYLTLYDTSRTKLLEDIFIPPVARLLSDQEHKISIAEIIHDLKQSHLMIIGEPGAGKSTLLRQLAESAWNVPEKIGLHALYLPILVPLRRLASAEGSLKSRLAHAMAGELSLMEELPPDFFTDWPIQTGKPWLLLLDGLDEVPTAEQPYLMQWLDGIIKDTKEYRIIITSRPPGNAPNNFVHALLNYYELLPFTMQQAGDFAHNWFGDRVGKFLEEIRRVRVGALYGTPLLLTIAAKVYSDKGALPERRVELYEQFVDIWLNEAKQRGLKVEIGTRVCKIARFALAHLALAMTKRHAEVSKEMLADVVADYLRSALNLSNDEAMVDGTNFVDVMARRSGVFTQRGGAYVFIHHTFREYLTAIALRLIFFTQDEARDSSILTSHDIGDGTRDVWKPVLEFLIELCGKKQVITLIDWLLCKMSPYLAADCYAVASDAVKTAMRDTLACYVYKLYDTKSSYISQLSFRPYRDPDDDDIGHFHDKGVRAIERISEYGESVSPILRDALANEHRWRVRLAAFHALKRIGFTSDDIPALGSALDEIWGKLSQNAAEVLALMGGQAVPTLINGVKSNHPDVRKWSCYALGRIGTTYVPAIKALIDALSDEYHNVRDVASNALVEINSPHLDRYLTELIASPPTDNYVSLAVEHARQILRNRGTNL